jgi:hypothetical protein
MVGGRLRCLGSNQHLKSRFGRGYELQVSVCRPTSAECEELAGLHLDIGSITIDSLAAICARFGDASTVDSVTEGNEAGWVVWDALQRLGSVPTPIFCEWWLTEARIASLLAFVHEAFPRARVAERQGCRIDFGLGDPELRVAEIFERVESGKECLRISEYSVSQDSMENIFNEFASQQEEEQGTAQQQAARLVAATTIQENPIAIQ